MIPRADTLPAAAASPGRRAALPAGPAPAPAAPRPDLRVVPGGRPRRRPRRLLGMAATVVTVLGVFGTVASHVALTQAQFRLERLQGESAREQQVYDKLRLQVAELEAPARVVAAAKERLGMVEPATVTYLTPPGSADAPSEPGSDHASTAPVASAPPTWPTGWSTVKPHLAGR